MQSRSAAPLNSGEDKRIGMKMNCQISWHSNFTTITKNSFVCIAKSTPTSAFASDGTTSYHCQRDTATPSLTLCRAEVQLHRTVEKTKE
jgi:hypothetical protein